MTEHDELLLALGEVLGFDPERDAERDLIDEVHIRQEFIREIAASLPCRHYESIGIVPCNCFHCRATMLSGGRRND